MTRDKTDDVIFFRRKFFLVESSLIAIALFPRLFT